MPFLLRLCFRRSPFLLPSLPFGSWSLPHVRNFVVFNLDYLNKSPLLDTLKTIHMDTNQQLTFLQERIEEIGSAIFYNQSEAVLKLPTSIVSTLKVDDYGFVWFFVQKPKQRLSEFEQEFPAKLDFYRKGTGCFLQVSGKGYVVTDPEDMNAYVDLPEDQKKLATGEVALVKVKIHKAEYYETRSMHKASWWQSARNTVSAWFRNNVYRPDGNTYFPAS